MATQVKPTRIELINLKTRLKSTLKGYNLLKDKQDEMIRYFMDIVTRNMKLRKEVEKDLSLIMNKYNKVIAKTNPNKIYELLSVSQRELEMTLTEKQILNINVPKIIMGDCKEELKPTYSFINSPQLIDEPVSELSKHLPKLIKLAELDKQSEMLSSEIEKTRRRVNAIEFVIIPDLETKIKKIQSKLDDDERSNTVRLMKAKEMIIDK